MPRRRRSAGFSTSTTNVSIKHTVQTIFNIEMFDITKNFKKWWLRLENAFKMFEIDVTKKAAYLLHYIGEEAQDILCNKISAVNPEDKNYEELVEILLNHFNSQPLEIVENFKFLQRKKQEDGESVQEFLTALQKLATACKFGDYLKTALRNQLAFGLHSKKIQNKVG